MTVDIRSLRPAKTAIAAVLAFTSPSVLAQTIVAPPLQAAPAIATSSPAFAPAQPVVQPTPSVEERIDAAITASKAETDSVPTAALVKARRTAPRPVTKTPSPAVATPKPIGTTPAPTDTASPRETTSPIAAAPSVAETRAEAVPPVTQPSTQTESMDPALPWGLGGGALLLIVLAAAALLRGRRRGDEVDAVEADYTAAADPRPVRAAAMPLMTLPPVTAAGPAITPEAASGNAGTESTLDAMVAAPPSPENPFRTHAKRMTRAKFLLAQQENSAEATPAALQPASVESAGPIPATSQTVYRFGSERRRETLLKPYSR